MTIAETSELKEALMEHQPSVAVLVPCYNEEAAVASVVRDFRRALPDATIYVYDNNSTDRTAEIARAEGAIVRTEKRPGKGYVVRRMFSDIEADIYILVDGDSTYEAAAAPRLVETLINGTFDKVNAIRLHTNENAYRPGHVLGNRLLTGLTGLIFKSQSRDMLSGYKALSRRFVKTFPGRSAGFEIETELLIHALELDLPSAEIETAYSERPEGSQSKLSTIKDGMEILMLIIHLIRDFLPLQFFASLALILFVVSGTVGLPVIFEYNRTGLVPHFPSAIAASALMVLSMLAAFTGLILDSVANGRREAKLLHFLQHPPVRY
jgi:glycosyltransferase involved in cell wall biosynthesis